MARRKQPETTKRRIPVLSAMLSGVGQTISRHPSIAGGTAAFAVAFGFVSINALMYQPSKHPAPLYNTRAAPVQQNAIVSRTLPIPASRVTTFKIERSDPQSTASIPDRTPRAEGDETVYYLQQAMNERNLYAGPLDGVLGPQTEKSLRAYQESSGLEITGKPTDDLLVHMLISNQQTIAVPDPRPDVQLVDSRSASPQNPVQVTPAMVVQDEEPDPVAGLIIKIQKGLSNIAYTDVKVDGVIGQQTRTAIADFQKHYRLPVTGRPDAEVLEKLREIGAL